MVIGMTLAFQPLGPCPGHRSDVGVRTKNTNTVHAYSIRLIFEGRPAHARGPVFEESKMQQLQEWFDRLAGVSAQATARQRAVEAVFRQPGFDPTPFERPAFWRRRARVALGRARG